jgi:hypothetical protein
MGRKSKFCFLLIILGDVFKKLFLPIAHKRGLNYNAVWSKSKEVYTEETETLRAQSGGSPLSRNAKRPEKKLLSRERKHYLP